MQRRHVGFAFADIERYTLTDANGHQHMLTERCAPNSVTLIDSSSIVPVAAEAASMARRKHSKRSKAKTIHNDDFRSDYVTGNPRNKDVADTLSARPDLPQSRPSTFSRE